jgi:AraC-like DNA-binding protein
MDVNPVRLELRCSLENDFIRAITAGNRTKVEELIAYRLTMFPNPECPMATSASDKLRSCKNALIGFDALCRQAAHQAGVPPLALQSLSVKFMGMIEDATSVQFLHERLFAQMVIEYVDIVLAMSVKAYGTAVQQAIVYICCHIGQELSLNDVALVCHMNGAHLSRQFKRETGMTMTTYINRQRIALAKTWLESGKSSLAEVAERVGFANADYFGKVFKRETGQAPSEYLRHVHQRKTCD